MNREEKTLQSYENVPDYIKEDVVEAGIWARNYMMRKEGEGHQFFVTANKDGTVCCSFAKPEWAGDHSSRGMAHGAEAIVMAVCEYINGL